MKIYKYVFDIYKGEISEVVINVEEKPKSYVTVDTLFRHVIKKTAIGKYDNYGVVYLLDENNERAREIFKEYLGRKIKGKEQLIKKYKYEISDLELLKEEVKSFLVVKKKSVF